MNQNSYFLAIWRECQDGYYSAEKCNNCIVPGDTCERWTQEVIDEEA